MKFDLNEYPILIMTLNSFPSEIKDVHELGYADAINKFEINNPEDGGYQNFIDDIYVETEIEVIGMTDNHDVICKLLMSDLEGVIMKDTIINYLYKFHDLLFSEYSNRSSMEIELLCFEDIEIELFNKLFSTEPFLWKPYELAGHFEFVETISSNRNFN